MNMQSSRKDLNILLLGETGVGKSTFINGLANYFIHQTLEQADKGELEWVIPTSFMMTSDDYEEIEIKISADGNEVNHVGQSATQLPQTYLWSYKQVNIRIIDTPGIGDTRGIGQDRINMQNIMTHISNLEKLDGIWILLKPNHARLTVTFNFCIKELLTHLHRDACKNIVFCFTNSRGTFYRPGDTLPALKHLLSEHTDVDIELNKNTIYCFDNESVRFLAAVKLGIKFSEEQREDYAKSWHTSLCETERLLFYTISLEPHIVKNTLSLNDARRLTLALSRPIAEMSALIQKNIIVLEERKDEVQKSLGHRDELRGKLYIPAIDLEVTQLDYPRTVCTSPRCVKHIKVGNVEKIDYIKHCHEHCYVSGAPSNTVNCVVLQQCCALQKDVQKCSECGCAWNVHMHITYDSQQVVTQTEDEKVKQLISSNASDIQIKQTHVDSLQSRIQVLEGEKKSMIATSAQLACFLKRVAIAPYNDAVADYIDHLIEIEKSPVVAGGSSRSKLDGLRRMRDEYNEEVAIFDSAMGDPIGSVEHLTPGEIKALVEDLYRLTNSGKQLAEAVRTAEKSVNEAARYSEKPFVPDHYPGSKQPSVPDPHPGGKLLAQPGTGKVLRFVREFELDNSTTMSTTSKPSPSTSSHKPNLITRLWTRLVKLSITQRTDI